MREAEDTAASAGLQNIPQLLFLTAGTLLYYVAARAGMTTLSLYLDNIALLWLPSGIGLVMVLMCGRLALPLIFLASLLANLPGMLVPGQLVSTLHLCVAAAANVLEAWLAARLTRLHLPHGLQGLSDLLTFVLRVCLVATVINAAILSLNLVVGGYISLPEAGHFAGMLIFSNTLGLLLVYPIYTDWQLHMPENLRQWLRWSGSSLILLVMVWLAFTYVYALIFLVPPALLYFFHYDRDRGISLMLLLSMSCVVLMAGLQPAAFGVSDLEQSRFMLFTYLFTTTVGVQAMALQHRHLLKETRQRQDWQFRANHDPVTGMRNRLSFVHQLESEILRAQRTGRGFTVGMLDIDHFKRINDTWGHQTGDQVLRVFADRLKILLREVDIVARYGGEEFIILFPETNIQEARQALERIRHAIAATPMEVAGQQIPLTVSGGLAPWLPEQPLSLGEILSQADRYLYAAKGNGRNRILSA